MDQNNNQPPKHVQVENNKKPEKKYIISYQKEGEGPLTYTTAVGIMEAFAKMVELKTQGAISIVVYQEVELKVTVH